MERHGERLGGSAVPASLDRSADRGSSRGPGRRLRRPPPDLGRSRPAVREPGPPSPRARRRSRGAGRPVPRTLGRSDRRLCGNPRSGRRLRARRSHLPGGTDRLDPGGLQGAGRGGHARPVLPRAVRLDPAALVDTVRRQQLDVLDCTPSQLRLLLDAGLGEGDAAPALVLVGGEAVDADLRDAALARSRQGRTRFWNVYGPTECTVDTTATPFTAGTPPTRIGRPLPNVRVHTVTGVGGMGTLAALGVP